MKVTTTIWTCDRCGATAETSISSEPLPGAPVPMPMSPMMTPPIPVDWREYNPSTPVLLCGDCNKDFAAWVSVMPPPRKASS